MLVRKIQFVGNADKRSATLTIPAQIVSMLGIQRGDDISFSVIDDNIVLTPVRR